MEQVTAQTTLAELAILRGKFGVTSIHLTLEHDRPGYRVMAILQTTDETVVGYGHTEAQALNEAFTRVTKLIGNEISKEQEISA